MELKMSALNDVLKFLKDSGTFYVATVDGDRPRVRPFSGIAEFEGKLYMPTNNKKKVFAQMMQNPHIEISAMAHGKWIRLEADVECDPRREARKAMLTAKHFLVCTLSTMAFLKSYLWKTLRQRSALLQTQL